MAYGKGEEEEEGQAQSWKAIWPSPDIIKGLEFRLLTLTPKEITQKYADGIERRHPHPNLKLRSLSKVYHL